MKRKIIIKNNTSDKVILFSDIHWGKSKNSEIKLNSMKLFIYDLIETSKKEKINTLIFLGDWFENRNIISVKILQEAYLNIKKISDAGLTLYQILGNHDLYYKDNNKINSIIQYSDILNIYPISKMTTIEFTKVNKKLVLCPWNDNLVENIKFKPDCILGHFNFYGAKTQNVVGSINKTGQTILEINKKCPLVFSGHFHLNYEYVSKKGKIISIGSPLELNWRDFETKKGIYILDLNNMKYEFKENLKSPLHKKLYLSKINKKTEDFSNIKGNYIKLVVDEEYDFEKVMGLLNTINLKNPISPCTPDFIFNNNNKNLLNEFTEIKDFSIFNLSILELFDKFINELDDNYLENLDKNKINSYLKKYYDTEK